MPSLKTRVQYQLLTQQAALDAKASQAAVDAITEAVETVNDVELASINSTLSSLDGRISALETP